MSGTVTTSAVGKHGATTLPAVEVDSYNLELKDDEGFLGDRASRQAFHAILENWRKPLRKLGTDPFGDTPSDDLNRSKLDALLKEGDFDAAGVIQSAIEEFAQELALVVRRFLKAKAPPAPSGSRWAAAFARAASVARDRARRSHPQGRGHHGWTWCRSTTIPTRRR